MDSANIIPSFIKRKTRTPGIPLERSLYHQGLFNKNRRFGVCFRRRQWLQKNDPPSDYSWAKPRLTIDRVIRRLVRLSAVSWLALLIVVLVSTWRLVWSVWSPNPIIRLLFVIVATVAAVIVLLVGKGGGTGGGSASSHCGGWPLILRGLVVLRCRSFSSSCSCAWLAPVWSPSVAESIS